MADTWTFPDPPNVAVLTTQSIVRGGRWIAHVSHDADDGAWQFHDDSPNPPRTEDAVLVSLRSMVERDPSLLELGDLPEGWKATREAPNTAWQRSTA